ncbi:MAG TPA: radical SAM protein [Elusimicrobiales bacterium]|nr:radical SAM protein [Elusimicrobiales bacterium]HOL63204.1 radical SAM protein [Elusimicrobiales bacterium]HPO94446.1 radical SAM protein [Elusimicrobiales bacterium]
MIRKKIDIKITFNCNNKCDFCAQGSKRTFIERKTRAEIIKALKDGIKSQANSVVFTGGEPTLHPDLIDLIKEAKRLKYEYIQIQTNGRTLSDMDFLKKIKSAGANEISPALHGSKPEIHDKLTNADNSFNETIKGIINSKKLGLYVLTNTVITSLNYKDLPQIAKLLTYLKVDQFQFAFVHIIGTAWEKRDWIVPKKSKVMPYLKKALDIGISKGIKCYTEAIPYCFMKGYEECVAEKIIPDGPVVDAEVFVENYGEYRRNEGKVKHKKCKKCFYFKICEGPWREYPEIFGWEEFKPVMAK